MTLKITSAIFHVVLDAKEYSVIFEAGKVRVENRHQNIEYNNADARWKPCSTHAFEIIRLAYGVTQKTNVAKRRSQSSRPCLRVVRDEEE